jgi:cytochrome c oxidase cbb3-type subunit IV
MDINTLRGLGTLFALIAFVSVCLWAYSSKRKQGFDAAANLPFADDDFEANETAKADVTNK